MKSGDPTLQDIDQVPENFDDSNHHTAIAFYYCSDAYGVFLDGVDDFKEQDQFVEDRYGIQPLCLTSGHGHLIYHLYFVARKNESILADLEAMKMELQTLATEYSGLTEKPVRQCDIINIAYYLLVFRLQLLNLRRNSRQEQRTSRSSTIISSTTRIASARF